MVQAASLFEDIHTRPPDSPRASWKGSALVYGPAQTQGSKKGFVHPHLKRVVIVDDNDRALKSWRQEFIEAMAECRPKRPLDQSAAVLIVIYVRRPSHHYGSGKNAGILKATAPLVPPSGKDIDKVCRAIFDAGQIAGWWCNDARVADVQVKRRYDEGLERTCVWAWALDSPTQPMPDFNEPDEVEADIEY